METDEPHVYAIGDIVAGMPQLAHAASMEGITAVGKITGKPVRALERRRIPNATYCEPQIGSIGLTERQARREAGFDVKVGKFPFLGVNSRGARSSITTRGFHQGGGRGEKRRVSRCAHRSVRWLPTFSPEPVTALQLEATVDDMMFMVHAHPTVWEALGDAFSSVRGVPIANDLTAGLSHLTNMAAQQQCLAGWLTWAGSAMPMPLAVQQRLVAARKAGTVPDILLICEHPHVLTLGRSGKIEHLRVTSDLLRQMGVEFHSSDRGGDITYHGPGQIVGYPILRLAEIRRDVGWHVRQLEEAMIRATAAFGITAFRVPGRTGVWVHPAASEPVAPSSAKTLANDVTEEKLGAIGVHISRWVTSHGFAYNVSNDLRYFDLIVPCGIADRQGDPARKIARQACVDCRGRAASNGCVRLCPRPEDGQRLARGIARMAGRGRACSSERCRCQCVQRQCSQ